MPHNVLAGFAHLERMRAGRNEALRLLKRYEVGGDQRDGGADAEDGDPGRG
jgi:hypothetical protein